MKVKLLDMSKVGPSGFKNRRSLEAVGYAVAVINNLIRRQATGDIVLHYETLVKVDFELVFADDGSFVDLVDKSNSECHVSLINGGVTTVGKIEYTMREVREYFKLWRVLKVTQVEKATTAYDNISYITLCPPIRRRS